MQLRALVVDDEPDVRALTEVALREEGFDCECAVDGTDGLAKFANGSFDLVVADLRMPNRHGHSMVVELLNREPPPAIIVLTGVAQPQLAKDLLARGVTDIMFKPVNYRMFAAKARTLVGRISRSDAPPDEASDKTEESCAASPSMEELFTAYSKFPTFSPHHASTLTDFDWPDVPDPPRELWDFAEQISIPSPYGATERRGARRLRAIMPVTALRLTSAFRATLPPLKLLTRDLSVAGIGLVHTEPLDCKHLLLFFRDTPVGAVSVAVSPIRFQELRGFYDIGTIFSVTRESAGIGGSAAKTNC